jgi:molecular chaperone DnaK
LAGVGPHGRTRTQRGLGEPQPVEVLPAHAFASPPPLDAPSPESPRIPAVTVRAPLPLVEGLDDIDILDLDAPVARAPSSIPPLHAPPAPAPRKAPPPPAPRAPRPATLPPITAPITPRVTELSEPISESSPYTESRPFDLRMPAQDLDDGLPPLPANFETAQAAKRSFGVRRAPVLDPPQVAPPLLVDVTPLALGVEVVGGYTDTLIARNSPVPCERSRAFVTARDDQTMVRVRVSQGQSSRFAENTLLGEVELSGLLAAPRGEVKIEVTFALDESGILSVSARDAKTGAATRAQLKLIGLAEAS